jgi:uncharacterized protein (DUF1684 family)
VKTKNILILLVTIIVVVTVFYSFQEDGDEAAYAETLQKEREDKDNFMKTSAESPFSKDKEGFTGLKYYAPNSKFRIVADLTPVQDKTVHVLTTNDGKEQRYIEYAYVEFDLDNSHNKLLVLEGIDIGPVRGQLFLAFGDNTSARDTYGGGRYLDVAKVPGSKTMLLDFNKAYNPYCAYAGDYSCPLPPRENLLEMTINAGEKKYHE